MAISRRTILQWVAEEYYADEDHYRDVVVSRMRCQYEWSG